MIAVDTNVLVYAHRTDSPFHADAAATVRRLAEGAGNWAIPWPCLHEFYSIATHPRIYVNPSSPEQALAQIAAWLESPTVVVFSESANYWPAFRVLVERAHVLGPAIHDARIAALCESHGIRELVTLDRDFGRFPGLTTVGIA